MNSCLNSCKMIDIHVVLLCDRCMREWYTVNSLMFAGINLCIFWDKAVSSGLVNYLSTHELCLWVGILCLRFKNGREIRQINPPPTLMNLQYHTYSDIELLSTLILYDLNFTRYSFLCTIIFTSTLTCANLPCYCMLKRKSLIIFPH